MKGLYGDQFGKTWSERPNKRAWLTRFAKDGYRLIDALKSPTRESPRRRIRLMREGADDVINEIRAIAPDQILLIKVTVYDALFEAIREARLPIIDARLPFPGFGRQTEFQLAFTQLVDKQKVLLTNR